MADVSLPRQQVLGIPLPVGLTPYTLAFILLLVAAWLVFRVVNRTPLAFNPDALANLGRVIAPVVVIAAFIERAVEVVLTPLRGDQADTLESRIERLKAANQVTEAAAVEHQLHNYKLSTRHYAFFISVSLGILAGLLGFRCLEGLFATGSQTDATLRFFDVVLTGLVIGGGADGIHKPVQAFTDYMEKVSKAAKANP